MLLKRLLSITAYCPLFDMVIYPATGGIVVVVVIANEVSFAEVEIIYEQDNFTTEPLGLQDKKENQ